MINKSIKKRILVMEDERPLAAALEIKLKAADLDVDVAYDGEEGMVKLRNRQYDLLLLDLIMPKKDGFAVLRDMASQKIKMPIIALSNLSQREDIERSTALGVSKYFVKSDIPLHELVGEVRSFLDKCDLARDAK